MRGPRMTIVVPAMVLALAGQCGVAVADGSQAFAGHEPWDNPPPPPGPYGGGYDPWGGDAGADYGANMADNNWRGIEQDPSLLIPPPSPGPYTEGPAEPPPWIPQQSAPTAYPDPVAAPVFPGDAPALFPGEQPATFPGLDYPEPPVARPAPRASNPWQVTPDRARVAAPPNRWAVPRQVTRWNHSAPALPPSASMPVTPSAADFPPAPATSAPAWRPPQATPDNLEWPPLEPGSSAYTLPGNTGAGPAPALEWPDSDHTGNRRPGR